MFGQIVLLNSDFVQVVLLSFDFWLFLRQFVLLNPGVFFIPWSACPPKSRFWLFLGLFVLLNSDFGIPWLFVLLNPDFGYSLGSLSSLILILVIPWAICPPKSWGFLFLGQFVLLNPVSHYSLGSLSS